MMMPGRVSDALRLECRKGDPLAVSVSRCYSGQPRTRQRAVLPALLGGAMPIDGLRG